MGNIFDCYKFWRVEKELKKHAQIVMLGLDQAGKTTLTNYLKFGEMMQTVPNQLNIQTITKGNVTFTMWDLGGQTKTRKIWSSYLDTMSGLIYLVDVTDSDRYALAAEEFHRILKEVPDTKEFVVLVLFNKVDAWKTPSVVEFKDLFKLPEDRKMTVYRQEFCSVTKKVNVQAPIDWFLEEIIKIN